MSCLVLQSHCIPRCHWSSWIDHCNSVLFGLPSSTLAPLQRVQDVAARLVLKLDHRTSVKSVVQRLHWLTVKARIEFKIATLMNAILHQRGPASQQHYAVQRRRNRTSPCSSVPLRLMQLLLWGHRPSSGSAPSQSAVQVFGTRFPHTSETFILLRLFAKLI